MVKNMDFFVFFVFTQNEIEIHSNTENEVP